jgi:hypothetical protein
VEDLRHFARAHRQLLDQHPRVLAGSGLLALNYGWSAFASARDALPANAAAQVRQALAALPRSEYAHTAAVAEEMAAYASDRHYELVLDQIMVGIWSAAHRAANPSMDV